MSDYYADCPHCGGTIRVNMYGMGHCSQCGTDRNPMADKATPITQAPSHPENGFANVLDGARDVNELPKIPTLDYDPIYPDWTDDRLYRLADECELFIEAYNAQGHRMGAPEEARLQLQVIYDLVLEDGR